MSRPAATGYTTRDVSAVLDVPERRVRSWARDGLLRPARLSDGTYRFDFRDIIVLRTALELEANGVSKRRIHASLSSLREQLPAGRPLSAVRIRAVGDRVLVQDPEALWEPRSGQTAFDLSVEEIAARVEPIARAANRAHLETPDDDPDRWYDDAVDLEAVSLEEAKLAYARVLELAPRHPEALLNRGRLLHEEGDLAAAEDHYRRSLAARPGDALAHFNLGVVLEDRGVPTEAADAYREAVRLDPELAGAHFNLSRLLEAEGRMSDAFRHLATYRRLGKGDR